MRRLSLPFLFRLLPSQLERTLDRVCSLIQSHTCGPYLYSSQGPNSLIEAPFSFNGAVCDHYKMFHTFVDLYQNISDNGV